MKDWNGNKKAVFVTNGDSSHSAANPLPDFTGGSGSI